MEEEGTSYATGLHTYSICIHTVYAYIQYMHTYSICIHTVYAYIQYMHTYSIWETGKKDVCNKQKYLTITL